MKSWLFVGKLLPSHRQNQRGQTLVIFAFLAVFMLLLLGLVLDSSRLFILAAQAERVAEAAALAGALYMPSYFDSAHQSPDGQYAVKRACDVARENGVTNCPAGSGQVGADVEKVTGNQYEIQVIVTLQADVFFLAYISPSLSSATVSRPAVAEYLPPIELGSRSSYFGDQADGLQSFWASINGPLDLQEQGDAYTPTLQEGPTDPHQYPDSSTNQSAYSSSRFGTNFKTNHQQYGQCAGCPSGPIANPDQQPAGFAGYNYQIVVPANSGPIQVQIYNPAFISDTNYCTSPIVVPTNSTGDTVNIDAGNSPSFGCSKTDKQNEYLQMTYSLYSAPLQFERSADTLVPSTLLQPIPFQPPSLDNLSSDLIAHSCLSKIQMWDPQKQQCVLTPGYVYQWYTLYTIPNSTNQQTYRLSVQATGYYGSKNYAVRLTALLNLPPPTGVNIFAWNNMCVYFSLTGKNGDSIFDLGEIPADYAGKTLTFSLFDAGDTTGNADLKILDNNGNPVQLVPASYTWIRTTNNRTDLQASINGDRIYNGLWLRLPITIPSNYSPDPGKDWWQIEYNTPNGTPTDKLTIGISLSGSPIHLINQVIG
jgi:Flp pilus assembly protein TadG